MITTRVLLALAAVLVLTTLAAQPASAEGTLTGHVPFVGGIGLVEWSGGPIDALRETAEADDCRLSAVLLPLGDRTVHYVVGAPAFVNAEWSTQVGPEIEATPLYIVCAHGLESCSELTGLIFDSALPGPGIETSWEALEQVLGGHILLDGTFVDAGASDPRAVWELIADDGALVGRFTLVREDFGWRLNSAVWCTVR